MQKPINFVQRICANQSAVHVVVGGFFAKKNELYNDSRTVHEQTESEFKFFSVCRDGNDRQRKIIFRLLFD